MIKDIYTEVKKLNVKTDSHSSDLYVEKTAETEKLIADYEFKQNVRTFKSDVDGSIWYDIPFAYSPYWENRMK